MGARQRFVIPLTEVAEGDGPSVGGKAARVAMLARAGFAVPTGFCLSVEAYQEFLTASRLTAVVQMELGRKAFADMRWEELWDAALRIRSAFVGAVFPDDIATEIAAVMKAFPEESSWAVRSSAPGEDSSQRSFAGLHESYLGVRGLTAVLDAVRRVWASLWSDAAMLYRRELNLDPARSRMAVLIQSMRSEPVSGVAFGRDPREPGADHALVEAVPGLCSGLVDGEVDPDRWKLLRLTGDVLEYRRGQREGDPTRLPLLESRDLLSLAAALGEVESLFGWPPDVEWTGRGDSLTLLQARPITALLGEREDARAWYLTLRPGTDRLRTLRRRVADELIPELEVFGKRLASERLDDYTDAQLADALAERTAAVRHWRQVYAEQFIPFAHGVRQLGVYYNDAVRPQDPYEFVGLLRGEALLAVRRNAEMAALAEQVRSDSSLRDLLIRASAEPVIDPSTWRRDLGERLRRLPASGGFADRLAALFEEHLDIAYGTERLYDMPGLILHGILELARSAGARPPHAAVAASLPVSVLEERLMQAVGPDRHQEAREVLEIGRVSWQLRDNDNLLLARVESQWLRAIQAAAERLKRADRLEPDAVASEDAAPVLIEALRRPSSAVVTLPKPKPNEVLPRLTECAVTARQLVGQPAAPGLQSGRVRRVRTAADLGRFLAGEVLVCDAIQPMMTQLVPLAAAIVERRGGMLIHGAIIARELGIPCVNGVAGVVDVLRDGDLVTVDGYLGIVTVGAPEFDLELAAAPVRDGAP